MICAMQIFGIAVRSLWCSSSMEAPTWRAQGTCLMVVSLLPMEMSSWSLWTIGLACSVSLMCQIFDVTVYTFTTFVLVCLISARPGLVCHVKLYLKMTAFTCMKNNILKFFIVYCVNVLSYTPFLKNILRPMSQNLL